MKKSQPSSFKEGVCLLLSAFSAILLFDHIISGNWQNPDLWHLFRDIGGPFLVMLAFL